MAKDESKESRLRKQRELNASKSKTAAKKTGSNLGGRREGAGRPKLEDKYKIVQVQTPAPVLKEVNEVITDFWRSMDAVGGVIDGEKIYSDKAIKKKLKDS